MQKLFVINGGRVVVQDNSQTYSETYENYLLDGGIPPPAGITSLDYNKTLKTCSINGKAFQEFPWQYAENVIDSVSKLCNVFDQRKKVREEQEKVILDEKERVEKLANMTQEEKADLELKLAKSERAEAVSRIIVEVDGMKFDGDEESQTRMGRTISAAIALGVDIQTHEQIWVLSDNSVASVTVSQLAKALKLAGESQTALWTVPYQKGV